MDETGPMTVEVRGRQRVRNVALGVTAALLLLFLLTDWSRSWGAASPAECLRARQVAQATGLALVAALVLLGLRALELVLLPRSPATAAGDHDAAPTRAGVRERWATGACVVGLLAATAAVAGVALTVVDTLRTSTPGASGPATCAGRAVGEGTGAALVNGGLLVLLLLVCALVVWSRHDLPLAPPTEGTTVPTAWARKRSTEAETAPPPDGTVICCSGGGIRSAAFCLGGLQALDATPVPGGAAQADPAAPPPSIYADAREVVGVSGGGYMAAAWHVARHPKPPGQHPPPRSSRRRSLLAAFAGAGPREGRDGGLVEGGEGGGRGAALTTPTLPNGTALSNGTPPETLTLDADPARRPFGTASPELRRLRRNTTYLASSGAVRVDAALSWLFGTVLMWAVTLASIGVTAWVLSLFVERLDLAQGLDTPDATTWSARAAAVTVSLIVLAVGPVLFFSRRLVQMRLSRRTRSRLPDTLLATVLPALAAGIAVTALLLGVPAAAVMLHDTTVRNQPVPLVASVVHTLGYAAPGACEAATNDGTFARLYAQQQARAQAAGHPVTFAFGACGSEVEVLADPKVPVTEVSPAARTALAFAPGLWQQLAASGAALALFGGLVRSMIKGRQQPAPTGRGGGLITFLRLKVAPWLATVLAVTAGFLLLVKWLADDLLNLRQGGATFLGGYWPPAILLVLLLVLKMGTSATWMSMHPYYRDRLRSAYLLRRTSVGPEPQVEPIDDGDLDFTDHVGQPDLVLCGTANLSDDELVPSGRQGAPFLFSARTIGFDDPNNLPPGGAVQGSTYALTTRDVRISAAIAISGAALAPVMGRENRNVRPFRLVMALCNVRTGVWLPNPYWVPSLARARRAGGVRGVVGRFGQASGTPGVGSVLREGLGWTSLMSRHVYVTDGGQLENLGLVVALRRRPASVYVLDASGDQRNSFSTLAQAIAMARIDSGVEVEDLDLTPLECDESGFSASASATATVRYSDGSTARLVYVKALVPRGLPWDVEGYRRIDGAFPMTGTEDQLYGEFDVEAYRELGWFVTKGALEAEARRGGLVGPQRAPANGAAATPGASSG